MSCNCTGNKQCMACATPAALGQHNDKGESIAELRRLAETHGLSLYDLVAAVDIEQQDSPAAHVSAPMDMSGHDERVMSWMAVADLVGELDPECFHRPGTGEQNVVHSIRMLAARPVTTDSSAAPSEEEIADSQELHEILASMAEAILHNNGEYTSGRAKLVKFIAALAAQPAPVSERDAALEEARAACIEMAGSLARGAYREACHGCANAIQLLKYEQPAAPAVAAVDARQDAVDGQMPLRITAIKRNCTAEREAVVTFSRMVTDEELAAWLNSPATTPAPGLSVDAGLSAAVPEGWQLVPKVPTHAMLNALSVQPDIVGRHIVRYSVDKLPDAYATMLTASPTPKG